jgi:hypothetical protein
MNMLQLVRSASKIVFIMLSFTACLGLFYGKISEANFMILAVSAFAFYFSKKGDTTLLSGGK